MPLPASVVEPVSLPVKTHLQCFLFLPKLAILISLPQGKVEKDQRVVNMAAPWIHGICVLCTVTGSCEAVCPKGIGLDFISKLNRDFAIATAKGVKPS